MIDSLMVKDLAELSSWNDLEKSASTFGNGAESHQQLETMKAAFTVQLDLMKELARVYNKSIQRLKSEHTAEEKFQGVKKKRLDDQRERARVAAAKEKAKGQGVSPQEKAASQAEAVVVSQEAKRQAAASKHLLKIDFGNCGHFAIRREHVNSDTVFFMSEPCIIEECGDLQSAVFDTDESKGFTALWLAFRGGFGKAAAKIADGRLGYGVKDPGGALAQRLLKLSSINGFTLDPPDKEVLGQQMHELVEKAMKPHFYRYKAGKPQAAGSDPRQLASLKAQFVGSRFIVASPIHLLAKYVARRSTAAAQEGEGDNVDDAFDPSRASYAECRALLLNLNTDLAKDMAEAGVSLFYALVEPNTILYMPAGFLIADLPSVDNMGLRISFFVMHEDSNSHAVKSMQALASMLAAGPLSETVDAALAAILARHLTPDRDEQPARGEQAGGEAIADEGAENAEDPEEASKDAAADPTSKAAVATSLAELAAEPPAELAAELAAEPVAGAELAAEPPASELASSEQEPTSVIAPMQLVKQERASKIPRTAD